MPKDPCGNKGVVPGVELVGSDGSWEVGPSERSLVVRDVTLEETVDSGLFLFVPRAC